MCHKPACRDCYPLGYITPSNFSPSPNIIEEAIERDESGGGSSKYYELPPNARELDDLIVAKNMPWYIANIFKACYRWGEKNSHQYEADKIEWMSGRLTKAVREGKL